MEDTDPKVKKAIQQIVEHPHEADYKAASDAAFSKRLKTKLNSKYKA